MKGLVVPHCTYRRSRFLRSADRLVADVACNANELPSSLIKQPQRATVNARSEINARNNVCVNANNAYQSDVEKDS